MRRSTGLLILVLVLAACQPGGESPTSGDSPSSSAVVATAVHGVVQDASGKPVTGVMVAAVSTDMPARAVPELAVVTDPAGLFEWPLPPGRYRLEVTVESRRAAADVEVKAERLGPTVVLTVR